MKIGVLFSRLGPYHHARLLAAAQKLDIVAIEYSKVDRTYAWQSIVSQTPFTQITLFQDSAYQDQPFQTKRVVLESCLAQIQPNVVVIPGWSNPLSLIALNWCEQHRVPTVLMSETTAYDEVRLPWKEWLKRRILKAVSTALVGGHPHKDYLIQLGLPSNQIFLGYDVVDNLYFFNESKLARSKSVQLRQDLKLPKKFFLASARFIHKKNIKELLNAYAQYRIKVTEDAWDLVLLGDGDLKQDLLKQIDTLGLAPWVYLPGFKQYDELPIYYGLAECFIHASTTEQWGLVVNEAMASGLPVIVSNRCGCAPDLVQEGQNGFTFDPYNTNQLTDLMIKISAKDCDLIAMGQVSQAIIAQWSPQTFAENLSKAVALALKTPLQGINIIDRALLWVLSQR